MTEIKQTLFVKNHKLQVNLPKEFNYKQVNIIITPYESEHRFSFENSDFVPINLNKNKENNTTTLLRDERDLK